MISHKRYFLATHPKLQAISSKSLMRRLITSYRVRDWTNHILNEFLISKSEFIQQFSFLYYYFICFIYLYLSILVISYSQALSSIWLSGDRVILFFYFLSILYMK